MNPENQKGLRLMEQLKPRLIIPTHVNLDATKQAIAQWPGFFQVDPGIEICADDLGDQTQILFLGETGEKFSRYVELGDW
jgi:hypothetical protein